MAKHLVEISMLLLLFIVPILNLYILIKLFKFLEKNKSEGEEDK